MYTAPRVKMDCTCCKGGITDFYQNGGLSVVGCFSINIFTVKRVLTLINKYELALIL